MKYINILGSTGSIGKSAIEIIKQHRDKFAVQTLFAGSNAEELVQQALALSPSNVCIMDEGQYVTCKNLLRDSGIAVYSGKADFLTLAATNVDMSLCAISGIAGLEPTIAAVQGSSSVLLANKESIVCAGPILKEQAEIHGTQIIPVDSEHVGILQALGSFDVSQVKKIMITASGGPFLNMNAEQMRDVTPEIAVKHPNWSMGQKISVDCATLFNKGLEVIEAYFFFPVKYGNIEVLVHPESIIHALIYYNDGSVISQMCLPDMKTQIAYSMSYPQERLNILTKPLDLAEVQKMHFYKPDYERFPLLQLAIDTVQEELATKIILNCANEYAVESFLQRKIGFLDIYKLVRKALEDVSKEKISSVEDVLELNIKTRRYLKECENS